MQDNSCDGGRQQKNKVKSSGKPVTNEREEKSESCKDLKKIRSENQYVSTGLSTALELISCRSCECRPLKACLSVGC